VWKLLSAGRERTKGTPAVLLDVDGTLVDSVYWHTIAWSRAFRDHGVDVPAWTIHRHVGMGGDHLIEAVAGADVEVALGDHLRDRRRARFSELLDEVRPLPGADQLLRALGASGVAVSLASSAEPHELERYVALLDADDLVDDRTDAGDVTATKPEPELVEVALARLGGPPAVMVGDATWDCIAAGRAGIPTIGVLTGGFSRTELLEAGAVEVADDLDGVRQLLLDSNGPQVPPAPSTELPPRVGSGAQGRSGTG
jgi:HAD superfamily hydrolase (TIGR01509 family)